MSTETLDHLLNVLDELGPDPFLDCGCLDCLEVVEASISNNRFPLMQEMAA